MSTDQPDAEYLSNVHEAILEAVWAFERLNEASTMPQQVAAYRALQGVMSDLATFHPDYDTEPLTDCRCDHCQSRKYEAER